jgi:GH24 family phage-related lysozyme (muramidase)
MTEIIDEELEGANVRPAPPEGEEEPPERERGAGGEQFDEDVDTRGPGARKLSNRGAAFIGRFEGCRLQLYNDPAGHCTIGIGHLVHHGRCDGSEPAEFKRGITRERAFELLAEDAAEIVAAIRRRVGVPLTQPRFDALCSWGFNCGPGVFVTSTLVRKLNAGDYASVRSELARWDKAGNPPRPLAGLTRRRKAEGRLFAEGKYE